MKKLLFLALMSVSGYANLDNINYFDADFRQNITDDQNKTIVYKGHIKAAKPQYALWEYTSPVNKQVYVSMYKVILIEPELEQAIIKKINTNFDFFSLIKNAKRIDKEHYVAHFDNKRYLLFIKNSILHTIQYKDEFDNNVTITFSKINEKKKIDKKVFIPHIPVEYDLVTQ
jgi:outer membrane lipoprotein carrier protein